MRIELTRRFKRWRHGRGFGIHSPFAYSFVKETLRQKLPYYAYELIDAMTFADDSETDIGAAKLKLIFRIAVRFSPTRVAVVGKRNAEALRKVVVMALPRKADINSQIENAKMVIVCDGAAAPAQSEAVYIFPDTEACAPGACDRIWDGVTRGMRFDNGKDMTIIVVASHLPRQRFSIKF